MNKLCLNEANVLRRLWWVLVSAPLLCWPAFVNGGAFYFPDTSAYLRGADAVIFELTSTRSEWSDRLDMYNKPSRSESAAHTNERRSPPELEAKEPLHPVLLGRSVYYGLLILPLVIMLGSAGGAAVQAIIAALTINLTLAGAGLKGRSLTAWQLVLTAVLSIASPLAYFVSLLMPDLLAGVAVVCSALALAYWRRFIGWERAVLIGLLMLSCLSHSSHVLITLIVFTVGLAIYAFSKRIALAALLMILASAGIGTIGERLFVLAVAHRTGEAPIRPPFLTARLISQGPGYRMLLQRCPEVDLLACRFIGRMPADSDTFLWSLDPAEGVFSATSHATQRKLAAEDFDFALSTIRQEPLSVLQNAIGDFWKQARLAKLNIFNVNAREVEDPRAHLPRSAAKEIIESRYYSGTMPVYVVQEASVLFACITLAMLGLLAATDSRAASVRMPPVLFAGLILVGLCANAAITGALSKPHDRYNARAIWTLPLAAISLLATRRRRTGSGNVIDRESANPVRLANAE